MTEIFKVDKIELPAYLYVYDILCDPALTCWLLYEDSNTRTIQKIVNVKIWPAYIRGFIRIFKSVSRRFGLILRLEKTGLEMDEVWGMVVQVDNEEELSRLLRVYEDVEVEYYYIKDIYYTDGTVSEGYFINPKEGQETSAELPHCIYMSKICNAANFWDRRVRGYKWKFFKNLYNKDRIPILATSCRCVITDYSGEPQEIQCNCDPDGLICKMP